MKLSESEVGRTFIGAIYGDPGVGKSEFLASVNTDRAVFFTDQNGIRTVRNARVRALYPKFDPFIEVVQMDKSLEDIKGFNQMKGQAEAWFTPDNLTKWDWLLIDDMTLLRKLAGLQAIKDLQGQGSNTLAKLSKDGKGLKRDIPKFAKQDMGREITLVDFFFDDLAGACRSHGKNLLIAAHERAVYSKSGEDKDEVLKAICPNVIGKAAPKALLNTFDFVFRITRSGKGESISLDFQCHPTDIIAAKDRDYVFKAHETNLTMAKVLDRIAKGVPAYPIPVPKIP